jgi:hypothetical protein
MADIKVKLISAGIRELLKSPEIEDELTRRMERVKSALGSTAELYVTEGPTRVAVKVARGSDFEEANTGELSKALDLAGGRRGTQIKTPKPKRGV